MKKLLAGIFLWSLVCMASVVNGQGTGHWFIGKSYRTYSLHSITPASNALVAKLSITCFRFRSDVDVSLNFSLRAEDFDNGYGLEPPAEPFLLLMELDNEIEFSMPANLKSFRSPGNVSLIFRMDRKNGIDFVRSLEGHNQLIVAVPAKFEGGYIFKYQLDFDTGQLVLGPCGLGQFL
ncbi:hypothetical protein [Saezia sanguinis]|uniref:hypothetical protein n=1 Tax=Saezia sanguinis TaxID=1965230 RepID=UPI003059A4AC